MPDRDRALDRTVSVHHNASESNSLRANRQPTDRRPKMHARPNPAIPTSEGGSDRVPERAVVTEQDGPSCFDQLVILRAEGNGAG